MIEPAHILIIDDDPIVRHQFSLVLGQAGYRTSTAGTGAEGELFLQLLTPDLVLIDLMLPDMNGQELLARLKADTSKPFIPVMLVTSQGDLSYRVQGLDAGADDFLAKPVAFEELLARVRALLRLQRSQRSLQAEQRKTELLLHLTRELGGSLDLQVLLTRFLDHLADAVGAVRASIILVDPEDIERVSCYSSSRNTATPILTEVLRVGVAGWALRERKPVVIADTHSDSRWIGESDYHQQVRSVAAMPVLREDRALGVITLVHHTPGYFSDEHLELLHSVAAQSAVTLHSAQLYTLTHQQKELIERRAEELQRINEMSQYMAELMQPDQLLRLVAHMVHHTFTYPLVTILVREGDDLVLRATAGSLGDTALQQLRMPVTEGINGWVLLRNRSLRVDDIHNEPRFFSPETSSSPVRAELAVPIMLQREVIGTLDVQSTVPGAFNSGDEALLCTIASQLGVALGNARLLENEQRRIRQLGQVNHLSLALTAQLDDAQNLQAAVKAVTKIFDAPHAGLVLLGEEPTEVPILALHGPASAADADLRLLLDEIPQLHDLLQDLREPLIVSDLQTDRQLAPLHRFFTERGISVLVLVPLIIGGRVLGLLGIDATGFEQQFGSAELELARNIASLIAQVVENTRLYRTVEGERSTINAVLRGAADPILLIGPHDELLLANRAAEERLGVSLSKGYGQPLTGQIGYPELMPLLAVKGTQAAGGPLEVTLPNGTIYNVSIAPLLNADNEPLGRVAVLQDITASKLLERQESDRVRAVFQRYVSPVVAEQLLKDGQSFGQPTERTVVVLFADIRGFTALTERIGPRVLIEHILNRYFTAMTEVLHKYDGTVDKFMGDGVIGVFGSPITRADDPQRALMASVEMQRVFGELRAAWQQELGLDVGIGIGVSYGQAVVGNIGSEQRLDYTLIGDVVNTASRLSSLAQPGQVIISHHLVSALPADWRSPWPLSTLGEVQLKGKQEPHSIYEVRYNESTIDQELGAKIHNY